MARYDAEKRARAEFKDLKLVYFVTEPEGIGHMNERSLPILQETLKKAGFLLDLYEDRMTLTIDPIAYARTQTRYAGPKKHHFVDEEKAGHTQDSNGGLLYSDIVYMMQGMNDTEIIEKTGIARRTFYRHKKRMLESPYYALLEPDKLQDLKYLESLPYNLTF